MRTINKNELRKILRLRFEKDLHTKLCDLPLPCCLKDAYKGANRIKKAIEKNQKVAIVGDYDVDGIISCVILSEFFDDIGFDYVVRIPNRFKDGYGLNAELIKELDVDLIITVDNGIAAIEAAKLCKEKGIDLIITDHHTPQDVLPEAFAIINPKQKDCDFPNIEICGAQVAWYLIAALKELCKLNYNMSKFLELLAIAIIADMMELRDLNRALVRRGFENINKSKRAAFQAIKQYYQKDKFALDNIGFLIAPLINSAGRMDDASISYEFLHTKDFNKACIYLGQIVNFNESRKDEEKQLFEESLTQVRNEESCVIVVGENWHEGVLGIVSSRLAKHYNKPAFVFSLNQNKLKGSARSVGKIDILSLISKANFLLSNYGGHKGAAGLSLNFENYESFKKLVQDECKQLSKESFCDSDEVLGVLEPSEIDFEMLEILEFFEPFGYKNPRPFFILENLNVKSKKILGRESKHLKLILTKENKTIEALFFNFDKEPQINENISLLGSISKNEFKGLITPQFIVKEIL
ncbi:single-stranded-DNA-specific exonuclease RecJ [Campylobacter sp. MIT 21-1685]|uniref:single-stranded-DNA-specific exonuclease RecJ n=1 Tax=unclassified Campylobacter TaxID=2593542 RepID=UPI00224B808A|nr:MULTISPECIES: single-stranded-DNA-specific exonuclease RecJ [unclassified Campylobacter]MCX2683469.1 single-stranded-DNA-specific exonuclease RecJ [Campylobacter sp. MIT 21-1684]MCX2751709.1 single-stranded-DNA-specific exonuclease RecJ [Campylobacter sp. MIT 21-1682]MCX2807911.1 single-stranded-DNA-specific exonuclease RecJ [Campylobacter sp. MIT 21-1685]